MKTCFWLGTKSCSNLGFAITRLKRRDTTCNWAGPDIPIRTALFMDDAIQRHAAYAMEIEAWQALPDPSAWNA